ncbi:cyclin h [Paramyrothecium foliicola]|nr:cyclin h [Paramyrothecium foliicola]
MLFTKKIDRAFQWTAEKMGAEAKTTHSDDFKMLETEMNLRHDGMERLQKGMTTYLKWMSRRCDAFEDKERNSPSTVLGRTMAAHGDDFEPESEFGNCLATMGRANERIAEYQDVYTETITGTWVDHLERSVAMMKEYAAARKKLENRRLAYDASSTKLQKARRDDYRVEEEVRMNKAKFEESSEDVLRRMQDIKEAEPDSVAALTCFLDAELEYHERAAEELRRVRQSWTSVAAHSSPSSRPPRHISRSRSNTARSWQEPRPSAVYEEAEEEPEPLPVRPSAYSRPSLQPPSQPPRPSLARASTHDGRNSMARGSPTPLARIATDSGTYGRGGAGDDVFGDDRSTSGSGSGSPDLVERSASPATSYGSLSRQPSYMTIGKKAPPPPPPSRAKKPPPPVPTRREVIYSALFDISINTELLIPIQSITSHRTHTAPQGEPPATMATEDERYRHSSQFRLWSFTPSNLQDLRAKTNSLARQQIQPRLPASDAGGAPDFLTPADEARLVKFFTVELIRAAQFCELPTEIRATAAIFLRRFYVTNSVMTYPPTELLKTSLFFGCKAEGFYIRLAKLAEKFPNTTSEQILAGEFLLCQGIRFAFDVRHPFRALEGAVLELRRLMREAGPDGEDESRVNKAHARARDILKFSPLVTDVYFHYTPSQIAMAALMIVDRGLLDRLIPGAGDEGDTARPLGAHTDVRDKIMAALEGCRAMLEEEPPERMTDYWGTPEVIKSMKPLRRKLQRCRDPDRADLVALQRARREQAAAAAAASKEKKKAGSVQEDAAVFGEALEAPDTKRRRVQDDVFGGPLLGAAGIVFGLPLLMNVLFLACNDVSGCPAPALLSPRSLTWETLRAQMPWPDTGLRGFASWSVTGWLLAYYLTSLVLYRVLPAKEVLGTKLRESGKPLRYRFNGEFCLKAQVKAVMLMGDALAFSSTVVQLVPCAIGTYLHGSDFFLWKWIDENYLQLLTANIGLAFLISVAVYVNSFSVRSGNPELRELARGGHTGSVLYDFFIGRELNPRVRLPLIGEVDVKAWLEMRPGLTGWVLLNAAFVAKQHRAYGYVSDSILFLAGIQAYYVLEGQYAEQGLLGMMDITIDGLGFMLTFGDIVWVPFLYSTQCRYLATYPVHMGPTGLAAAGFVFAVGLYIFRASNSQKNLFRKNPDDPAFKDMPYIQTKRGTRLLTGGWWGRARHINYLGDWLQSLPFCLPTGIAGYVILPAGAAAVLGADAARMLDGRQAVPGEAAGWGMLFTYFYSAYFGFLLIHREGRDDRACAEKYGDDWVEYKRTVKWRILPGVY